MVPRIGLTTFNESKPRGTYTSLSRAYSDSIMAARGLPLPIPLTTDRELLGEWIESIDGIMFTGGGDMASWRFGQEPARQLKRADSLRDECELILFELARKKLMPVLGICRGHQLINVALGGTLHQDLYRAFPDSLGHSPEDLAVDELHHHIEILDPECHLARVFGTGSILVNSFHHQAVDRIADGLVATARSSDGIIEALEWRSPGEEAPWHVSAVQFHPECLTARHPEFLALFRHFVGVCAGYRSKISL